jgi:hypothetical protein
MIQQLKRRNSSSEARLREERGRPHATLASALLHVVLGVALISALQVPAVLRSYFSPGNKPEQAEQLQYIAVTPKGSTGGPIAARPSAPATAPRMDEPATPPLVAPREVPSTLPPVSKEAPAPSAPAAGPLVGGQGELRGAQPSYTDGRVWTSPSGLITAPKTEEERLDSAVIATFRKYQDSMAANAYSPNKFERGDWTVEKNGKKYGIDQQFIRLGKFSIPTALLALLPFNAQTNPTVSDRNRQQMAMRMDIMEHAQMSLNEEEFRRAVKAIRERKEREHKNLPVAQGSVRRREVSGPVIAPSERPPE